MVFHENQCMPMMITIYNIIQYLARAILNEALLVYEGNISIGVRTITILGFADIDSNLIKKIDVTLITYGM